MQPVIQFQDLGVRLCISDILFGKSLNPIEVSEIRILQLRIQLSENSRLESAASLGIRIALTQVKQLSKHCIQDEKYRFGEKMNLNHSAELVDPQQTLPHHG